MFQWLRDRRARRLTIHELLEGWMIGRKDISPGVLQERALASIDATLYFLRERRLRLSSPGEVQRFVDLLLWTALVQNPPAEALLELLRPFLQDASESVQNAALQVLCVLRHPSSVPVLMEIFGTETDETLTSTIQYALGTLRAREAIPRLVKNARIQKSAWIRRSACDALGMIGGPEAVGHLRDLFEHERNEKVRLGAAIGLVRNGELDIADHLEKAFAGPDEMLASDAAEFWLESGQLDRLDRILGRLESEGNDRRVWLMMLQPLFPQMPQLSPDQMWAPPFHHPKPRHIRRAIAWLWNYRSFLRWDPERRCYLNPHIPIPKRPA